MSNHQKVAFITGAARRIGAEIARILHQAGMNVVIHYHTSKNEALTLCKELNSIRSHSAITIQGNLSDYHLFPSLIRRIFDEMGRLDVLINNASQFYKTPFPIKEKEWDELFDCNLKAPFFLIQTAIPFLKKTKGCVINIADYHGEQPLRDYSIYSISKAGLIMLTRVMAEELSPHIRVNAISPAGGILWPEGKNSLSDPIKKNIIEKTALKRPGSAQDIAQGVLFFAEAGTYITGQVLKIDGGRTA